MHSLRGSLDLLSLTCWQVDQQVETGRNRSVFGAKSVTLLGIEIGGGLRRFGADLAQDPPDRDAKKLLFLTVPRLAVQQVVPLPRRLTFDVGAGSFILRSAKCCALLLRFMQCFFIGRHSRGIYCSTYCSQWFQGFRVATQESERGSLRGGLDQHQNRCTHGIGQLGPCIHNPGKVRRQDRYTHSRCLGGVLGGVQGTFRVGLRRLLTC